MTEQTKDKFCGAILAIALGGLLILALSGCVNSTVDFSPSASLGFSGYNRSGVVETVAQQGATNGVHETWTDAQGGGQVAADVAIPVSP